MTNLRDPRTKDLNILAAARAVEVQQRRLETAYLAACRASGRAIEPETLGLSDHTAGGLLAALFDHATDMIERAAYINRGQA